MKKQLRHPSLWGLILLVGMVFLTQPLHSQSSSADTIPHPPIGFKDGWNKERVLAYPKGKRPAPEEYLKITYIVQHLLEFNDGASYFVPQEILQKYGCNPVGRPDGQFVLPVTQARQLINASDGDIAKIESALGVPAGSWDGKPLLLIIIPDPGALNLRIPSGNEAGANNLWIPGGYTPEGYSEAVLDAVPQGQYEALIVNPCAPCSTSNPTK